MATTKLTLLMTGFLIAMTFVKLSQCQRRRECDCGDDGNITYVCLLRCGRGNSGGNVVVLPVKRLARPFSLDTLHEKMSSHQARTRQEATSNIETGQDSIRRFFQPLWTRTMNKIRDILSFRHAVLRDDKA
ncbi:uncharacterized protein LOC117305304 [Asterias rubens]|uniref:uncharacterized protein LOC117305304 n=1 Tax=Asterias rubens TaxID=7604 RepID=UPI0014552D42|nr:uncharacterized protein LOC117305304 [Asterias rubens]